MLEARYRLPSYCFKKIYQKGNTIKGRFVTLRFIKSLKETFRFGFVISTRAIKKATIRNLIKRRAASIIKSLLPKIKTGFDFILIIKQEASFRELEDDIKRLLNV